MLFVDLLAHIENELDGQESKGTEQHLPGRRDRDDSAVATPWWEFTG